MRGRVGAAMAHDDTGGTTEGMKAQGYYDAHSEYQRRVLEAGATAIEGLVGDVGLDRIEGALAIADYGAGTGANSIRAMRTAIEAVRQRSRELPVVAIHNDLPTSDFGALRLAAQEGGYLELEGGPIYSTAASGSFFEQVVPDTSVGIGMCSNAAHWYRHQPEVGELDGMYFSAARGEQRDRLAALAASDWRDFLTARAAELDGGGRLLVQGIGTDDRGRVSASRLLDQMWQVAVALRDRGLLDGATLARFVFPVYCRTTTEAAAPLQPGGPSHGRLELVSSRMAEVANPYWEQLEGGASPEEYASQYTAFVRAFSESTLDRELFAPGALGDDPDAVRDEFFAEFERATAADPGRGRYEAFILTVVFAIKVRGSPGGRRFRGRTPPSGDLSAAEDQSPELGDLALLARAEAWEPMPQPCKRGRPGGRGRARGRRRRAGAGRGPQLAACVHQHRLGRPGDRGAVHPGQEHGGLLARGADPDPARIARDAAVGDVDVVGTRGEVLPAP